MQSACSSEAIAYVQLSFINQIPRNTLFAQITQWSMCLISWILLLPNYWKMFLGGSLPLCWNSCTDFLVSLLKWPFPDDLQKVIPILSVRVSYTDLVRLTAKSKYYLLLLYLSTEQMPLKTFTAGLLHSRPSAHATQKAENKAALGFTLFPGHNKLRVLIFMLSERWPLSDGGNLFPHIWHCHSKLRKQAEQLQNALGNCCSYLGYSPRGDQDVHTGHCSLKHKHRYRNRDLLGTLMSSEVRRFFFFK